jgi:GlcNAc-P-P-Und epimerase
MKIAITGASGFIGARLSEVFTAQGHIVVPIDTNGNNPVDIMDQDALTRALFGCEAIYHLAAVHRDDVFPRSRYYDVNVRGTENVLSAADHNGITRVIFTSSFAVYGLNTVLPTETTSPAPFNDYGHSKLEAEKVLTSWAKANSDRRVTIVRPVVVFGEGNKGNVHTLIDQIAKNRFIMIGGGDNKKSLAYVLNVVDFLVHTLSFADNLTIYNYADKPDMTTRDMVHIITRELGVKVPRAHIPYIIGLMGGYMCDVVARISGKQLPISAVRVQKFCADTTCHADKYRQSGFTPSYSIEAGLKNMIDSDFTQIKQLKCA